MADDDKRPAVADEDGDDVETESTTDEPPADDDNAIGRANIEKVDQILDEAGVNEGIAAGSRETHPDEGGPKL